MKNQRGGLGLSKQHEILSNAVDPIWFYKRTRTGPQFSTSQPRKCKFSLNNEKCGLFLDEFDGDDASLREFLGRVDNHIETKDPGSTGRNKIYLLVSDMSNFGQPTGSFGHGTISSKMMHTEIVVGESLYESYNVMYGYIESDTYAAACELPDRCRPFTGYYGKIYGLVYFGYVSEGPYVPDTPEWMINPELIIQRVSDTPLPPNQNIKLTTRERHPHSRWKNDNYTDSEGNNKRFCDPEEGKDPITMEELFIANRYNPIDFNCQTFCKAFMSILRCAQWFTAYEVNGRKNLKLDITQLSALKRAGITRPFAAYFRDGEEQHQADVAAQVQRMENEALAAANWAENAEIQAEMEAIQAERQMERERVSGMEAIQAENATFARLPDGWEETMDPSTGYTFYWRTDNPEATQWEHPGRELAAEEEASERAAARLAEENSPATPGDSSITPGRQYELHSSAGVAQPRSESPPSQGRRVDTAHDGTLDRNWSTGANDGDAEAAAEEEASERARRAEAVAIGHELASERARLQRLGALEVEEGVPPADATASGGAKYKYKKRKYSRKKKRTKKRKGKTKKKRKN